MPKSRKEKPSVSPSDLADRIPPRKACGPGLIRRLFGDVAGAGEILERLAQLLKTFEEEAGEATEDQPARGGRADEAALGARSAADRRATSRDRRAGPTA